MRALLDRSLAAGSVFAVLLSLLWALGRTGEFKRLFLARPEPIGLAEALRKETVRTLSQEDLRTLQEDGVVLIRGLVRDQETLAKLRTSMWHHAGMPFENTLVNHKSWLYNGAVRALLRDGPIGPLMAQAAATPYVQLTEAPIWGYRGEAWGTEGAWHADARRNKREVMHSIWMIVTDSENKSLEFARGSHKARFRMEDDCAKPVPGEKMDHHVFDPKCVASWEETLQKEFSLNGSVIFSPPMAAGDAFIFNGHTLHRGHKYREARLSFSGRFLSLERPGLRFGGCNQFEPLSHPPQLARQDQDCMEWLLLPGAPRKSPWLPASSISQGLLRLLGSIV